MRVLASWARCLRSSKAPFYCHHDPAPLRSIPVAASPAALMPRSAGPCGAGNAAALEMLLAERAPRAGRQTLQEVWDVHPVAAAGPSPSSAVAAERRAAPERAAKRTRKNRTVMPLREAAAAAADSSAGVLCAQPQQIVLAAPGSGVVAAAAGSGGGGGGSGALHLPEATAEKNPLLAVMWARLQEGARLLGPCGESPVPPTLQPLPRVSCI